MKHPLAVLTLAFCLGIFAAHKITIPFYLLFASGALSLIFGGIFLKRRLIFVISLCSLAFILGVILLKNSRDLPNCHITNFISYGADEPYIIKGLIENEPNPKNNATSFIFQAREIQLRDKNYNCCGKIIAHLKSKKEFNYGDELILRGKIYKPFNKNKSQRQSYRDYLRNNDIWFILAIENPADIINLHQNNGFILKSFAIRLKKESEDIIHKYNGPLAASILAAMVLGEKRNIPYFVTRSMMKSGTLHILVVSGFNVGIVSFVIILLLKLLRIPRRIRFYIAMPLIILYCLITGASNPVIRATIMAIIFMLGFLIKRESDIYNSLSLAAVAILAIKPKQLFDVGFQLSFLSVLSIVYLYPKITSLLRLNLIKIRPLRYFSQGLIVSLSAWAGTALPIAYYFKIFSPITVIANLLIVPLASLITLTGFSLLFIHFLFPPVASAFSYANEALVATLLNLNALLLKLPFASISWA